MHWLHSLEKPLSVVLEDDWFSEIQVEVGNAFVEQKEFYSCDFFKCFDEIVASR